MWQKKISSEEEWEDIAKQIFQELKHPILFLKGDLGAGKTTFTKYLLTQFKSKDEISSPTYSIVNEYDTEKGIIYHFDLYRLKNIEEAYDMGIEEYLENGYLSIIEWPEIFENEISDLPFHELKIKVVENNRIVEFK